ncbi:transmembrane protein 106B-like isoform X3 [Xiphias gladius]|uniref:transmembrane protein 106B-like isoform X3 n=1 Tax=Xiphias gladius TaxID=8245 RepID=UPI001A997CA9|nr:transmembrane protein 106B-like isoform X3 [Xiphias gladius]
MGAVPSRCDGGTGSAGLQHSRSGQDNDHLPIIEKADIKRRSSNRRDSSGETVHCPTCWGTGRIPRGQESKLVAVIPCNDQRLRPRHTKLYVAVSVGVCLMNVLNITNHNFATVQAYNLTVQALNFDMVVGTVSIKNVTSVKPLSIKTYSFVIPINLTDRGLSNYCKRVSLPVHILYVHLQMSMTVYYLAHFEQLSLETYEYIDCGVNSTIPHHVQLPPP